VHGEGCRGFDELNVESLGPEFKERLKAALDDAAKALGGVNIEAPIDEHPGMEGATIMVKGRLSGDPNDYADGLARIMGTKTSAKEGIFTLVDIIEFFAHDKWPDGNVADNFLDFLIERLESRIKDKA